MLSSTHFFQHDNKEDDHEEAPFGLLYIWLGDNLNKQGRTNIEKWRKRNPKLNAYLFIDSSLYYVSDEHETQKNLHEYKKLLQWAKQNHVIICDINLSQQHSKSYLLGVSELVNTMYGINYYLDEINGEHKNLAAASDIIRWNLIYLFSFIYIDAKDVYPGHEPIPLNLFASKEFFCNVRKINGISIINNDILASPKNNPFIKFILDEILNRYEILYKNENLLKAHRNPTYSTPYLMDKFISLFSSPELQIKVQHGEMNIRKISTVHITGPGVLMYALRKFDIHNEDSYKVSFPHACYSLPEMKDNKIQLLSWYDPDAFKDIDYVIDVLKSYIVGYFTNLIEMMEKNIALSQDSSSSDNLLFKSQKKNKSIEQLTSILHQLKSSLNAFDTSFSLKEIIYICLETLGTSNCNLLKKIKVPNWGNDKNIIDILNTVGDNMDVLIDHLKTNYNCDSIAFLVQQKLSSQLNGDRIETFIQKVLYTDTDLPSIDQDELTHYFPKWDNHFGL